MISALEIPAWARCICAVGAGGKTSLLYRLAEEYRAMGKQVLLVTTTKMYLPREYAVLDGSAREILEQLERDGFAVAGTTVCGGEKMGPLSGDILRQVVPQAEIVLAEADGSRRLPLKTPGPGEPVLPEACDYLVVVEGMSAVGKPLRQVCHRAECTAGCLNCSADHVVTEEMAAQAAVRGYETYLEEVGKRNAQRRGEPDGSVPGGCYFLNQADCLGEEQKEKIIREMEGNRFVLGSLKKQFRIQR